MSLIAVLGVAACAVAVGPVLAAEIAAEPLRLSASPISLNPEDHTVNRVGALHYRGGVRLDSSDQRFGGLSALMIDTDGRQFTALTDRGHWVVGSLIYAADGTLSDVGAARIGPLVVPGTGRPVLSGESDAESIAPIGGRLIVAFEGTPHRLRSYPWTTAPASAPQTLRPPRGMAGAPPNGGIEALTALSDGRLFAITERHATSDRTVAGWIGNGTTWQKLDYVRVAGFRPTGATTLPNGDVLVLERHFTWVGGLSSRLARIPRASIKPGAMIQGTEVARLVLPLTVENFEGIAVRSGTDGELLVYIVSDDNFSYFQRTLLMMFAVGN